MTGFKPAFVVQEGESGTTSQAALVFNGETLHGVVLRDGITVTFGVARSGEHIAGNVLRFPQVLDRGAYPQDVAAAGRYLLELAEQMEHNYS